jgi:hypothetical protein
MDVHICCNAQVQLDAANSVLISLKVPQRDIQTAGMIKFDRQLEFPFLSEFS